MTSYIVTNLVLPFFLFLFFVLNRTRVLGRRRVPRRRNTLLLANHQSMIDSFLIGIAAFYPHHVTRPWLIPWNAAAEENFFRNRLFAWAFDQMHCIPVKPGRRDLKAIYRSMRALRGGTMILFPEGTRTRTGAIERGRPGAGLVALGNEPTVIPVTIEGMDEVLPIGSVVPRIGKRITVYFGRPLDYSDLADEPRSKETAQRVVDRVMERLRFQRRVIRRLRRRAEG
ncbi:MAG: lysophospholipid acyltransferase family protein [Gemmatimonadota bacterium]